MRLGKYKMNKFFLPSSQLFEVGHPCPGSPQLSRSPNDKKQIKMNKMQKTN